jgi:hypothetical protein
MNRDEFLPYALNSYEHEYQRQQNITSKAFNMIGFVGVMVSVFSFILGGHIPDNQFLGIIILGLTILFASMIIIIYCVFPRIHLTLDPRVYYDKLATQQPTDGLTEAYVVYAEQLEWSNDGRVEKIECAIIIMVIGLAFSFLGTILSIL